MAKGECLAVHGQPHQPFAFGELVAGRILTQQQRSARRDGDVVGVVFAFGAS
jgi:hypothetical protein